MLSKSKMFLLILALLFVGVWKSKGAAEALVPAPTLQPTELLATTTPVKSTAIPGNNFAKYDISTDAENILANIDFVRLQERVEIYNSQTTSGNTSSAPPAGETVGEVTITHKFWGGAWREVYWVDSWYCNEITPGVIIKTYIRYFQKNGIPLEYGLPLVETESGYENYVWEGGACRLKQNNRGAPAYGAGQLYKPAHEDFDWIRLATDYEYGIHLSVQIYKGMYSRSGGNDWIQAAAWYKGFANLGGKGNGSFTSNYMPAYNRGSYTYRGVLIPYSSDAFAIANTIPK